MATLEELTVKIGVDAQDLDQELTGVQQNLDGVGESADKSQDRFSKAAKIAGGAAVGLGGTLVGLGGYALKAASDQAELANEIQTSASRAGLSTEAYQELSNAMGEWGLNTGQTNRLLERNNQRLSQAIEGNEKYAGAWDRLGVSLTDTNGNMRESEDVMMDTFAALEALEDPAERNALAADLYGTQLSRKLIPGLDGTEDSLSDLRDAYDENGHLTDEQIEAAIEFGDTMDDFKDTLEGVGIAIGNTLIPILQDHLLPVIQDHLIPAVESVIEWIGNARESFSDLPGPIQTILTELGKWIGLAGGLLVVMAPFLGFLKFLLGPLKLLIPLFKGLALAKMLFSAALWASPITWIVLGIIALIAVIILIIVYWDEIAAATAAAWEWIKGALSAAWDWIVELFTTAWEWLVELVTGLWESISEGFQAGIDWVVDLVVGLWDAITGFFSDAWDWLVDLVTGMWDAIVSFFQSGIDGAVELVQSGVDNVLDFFSMVGEVPGMIGGFFSDMVSTAAGFISDFLSDVGAIPGDVLSYIGDLGSLLFNAGKDIIQGLIDGVKNMVSNLRNTFSGITDMIPDWKGPHSVDIKLLEGPGEDIMEGLVTGIDNGTGDVRAKLGGVTRSIPESVSVGSTSSVMTRDQTKVVIDFKNLGRSKLAEAVREAVRIDGGGDVQTAFGRGGR